MRTRTHGCVLARISGNWGSSHPCGNIDKCGENNVQQKKLEKQKNKKGEPPGRETQGAVVRQDWYKDYWPGTSQIPVCVSRCASW
jgi:hypothetical protein